MPRKEFEPNILTAQDVNTYLMNQSVMTFANAAARTAALTAPTEGMVTYLQDVDELEVYNGASWLRLVISSDDEGLTVNGNLYANTGNLIANRATATSGTAAGGLALQVDGTTYARLYMQTSNEMRVTPTYTTIDGILTVGDASLTSANTSSQVHVRKDTLGGKGGELSIVNYASPSATGSSAALNFGVDPSTYGSDQGNAQIRATNANGANAATELGFFTWNGSAWGRRNYIATDGRLRSTTPQTSLGNANQLMGSMVCIPGSTYNPSLGGFSTVNVWTTVLSGQLDCSSAGVDATYVNFIFNMTAYVSAGGQVLMRVLFQPAGGGSYVSSQQVNFRNLTFDHFCLVHQASVQTANQYGNWYAQIYGAAVAINTDTNDSASCFFFTR